jgi:uncharacterized protein YqcC (DUF446 family)
VDAQLYEWMAPTIQAVQPFCDEPLIAAGTFQGAGGWAWGIESGALFGGLFRRPPKDVRARAGGLPDTVILAVGSTKVFVFKYKARRLRLEVEPPVRTWKRDDLVVRTDTRRVASKLAIEVASTGEVHELESTSMTGRLGKITREIFRLLEDPRIGAPPGYRYGDFGVNEQAAAGRAALRAGELAGEIEAELKRLKMWMPNPPTEDHVLAGGAFGMKTVPFVTWLQVVLVARLRAVAAGEMELPGASEIGTMAVRELDGSHGTDRLMSLIHDVDRLANDGV